MIYQILRGSPLPKEQAADPTNLTQEFRWGMIKVASRTSCPSKSLLLVNNNFIQICSIQVFQVKQEEHAAQEKAAKKETLQWINQSELTRHSPMKNLE
jgi:hypothetical protein